MGWLSNLFGSGDSADESTAEEATSREETTDEPRPELDPPERPWATVLYPFPLEFGRDDLEEALGSADISAEGVEAGREGVFRIELAETVLVLEQRDESYPRDQMDRRLLPETFPDDFAYLSVEPQVSDPLEKRDMLRTPEAYPDPWADETSVMRMMTRLVRQFLEMDGSALVLNRSGGVAVPAREFLDVTDTPDDGDWQGVLGWLDISYDEDEEILHSRGFQLFGLPDIAVRYDYAEGRWGRRREWEALAYASATMIRENRVLGADDDSEDFLGFEPIEGLEVPLGLDVADPELDSGDDRDVVSYSVEMEDQRLVMTADGPGTVEETWAATDGSQEEIALASYQAMFRRAGRELLGDPIQSLTVDDIPDLEPFDCDLYQSGEGQPVHFVTNGLGRGSRTTEAGDAIHLELAIRTSEPGEPLIDILANCAAGVELGGESWEPGDILEFEEPMANLQVFALSPLFEAEPESGPPIQVWQLVPMTEEEFENIDGDNAAKWLDEHEGATGPDFAARWQAALG